MERQLWKMIVGIVTSLDKPRHAMSFDYADEWIVAVWYWAVIHDRPVSWACVKGHWPLDLRKRRLPTPSTMSRRLKSTRVQALLRCLEQRVLAPRQGGLFWMIDGKPLPISGCSKDPHARYGRSAGCHARGYKIHAIVAGNGDVAAWRLAPMNTDERVMARRMLRSTTLHGYLLADSNYDSNPLHEICHDDLQLVTPRRNAGRRGLGHHRHSSHRLRSVALTENPHCHFGRALIDARDQIERVFAQLTNWGGGLNGLPAWVRTYPRVHRWVQAKFVLTALKRRTPSITYVA